MKNNLNIVNIFSSFVNVNKRFHRLAFDSVYIGDLNMSRITNISLFYDQTSLMDSEVLWKISSKILSWIHWQVHKLSVEEYSMKKILLAGKYLQIYSLSLINFQQETLYQYLTGIQFDFIELKLKYLCFWIKDHLILHDLLSKQITHLNIDMKMPRELNSKTVSNIFQLILSLCQK